MLRPMRAAAVISRTAFSLVLGGDPNNVPLSQTLTERPTRHRVAEARSAACKSRLSGEPMGDALDFAADAATYGVTLWAIGP